MGIEITLIAGKDRDSCKIYASGSMQHIINSRERSTFNLDDSSLKSAIAANRGKRPDDAYLCSPTPWGDLYKSYGWDQVSTNLVVARAELLGFSSEPKIVNSVPLVNNSSHRATFHADISIQETDTVSNSWSSSDTVSFDQKISYKVSFEGTGEVGGETSIGYSHQVGEAKTETKSVMVGSSAGVDVPLDPGQSVVANLSASVGTLNARLTYDAFLTGGTAYNYSHPYEGHHFWWSDINSVMSSGGLPNSKTLIEDIQVGFYVDAKVEIEDPQSGRTLSVHRLDAVPAM